MIRLLCESNKSEITARLINLGYNISGCKLEWVDDNGNYKLISSNNAFKFLSLEYSAEEENAYIDFQMAESDDEQEETFNFPSEMSKCVLRWNELVRMKP